MEKENLTEILQQHPFLHGLSDEHMSTIIGCASNVRFAENTVLIHEGQLANKFYLIRTGRVALQTEVSGRGPIRIQTVGPGEVLGWSWLIAPYRWHFSAVAVMETRAIALDAACLRTKCEADPHFGYEILKRLTIVMERRVEATRLQLLDVYGMTTMGAAS